MTAEIAIMNKLAIALAADSAVTIGGEQKKIYNTVNKLFTLTKFQPVGILIYGSASFMGVPWETIIDLYRKKIGRKYFAELNSYAEDFIKFIEKSKNFSPPVEQERYLQQSLMYYFSIIRAGILSEIDKEILQKKQVTEDEIRSLFEKFIEKQVEEFNKVKLNENRKENDIKNFIQKQKKSIDISQKQIFEKFPISQKAQEGLYVLSANVFCRFIEQIQFNVSGVVIAGFGKNDIYPSLKSYLVSGISDNRLNFRAEKLHKIDTNNSALIIPFAQSEMVFTFMEGVDPKYKLLLDKSQYEIYDRLANTVASFVKTQFRTN